MSYAGDVDRCRRRDSWLQAFSPTFILLFLPGQNLGALCKRMRSWCSSVHFERSSSHGILSTAARSSCLRRCVAQCKQKLREHKRHVRGSSGCTQTERDPWGHRFHRVSVAAVCSCAREDPLLGHTEKPFGPVGTRLLLILHIRKVSTHTAGSALHLLLATFHSNLFLQLLL